MQGKQAPLETHRGRSRSAVLSWLAFAALVAAVLVSLQFAAQRLGAWKLALLGAGALLAALANARARAGPAVPRRAPVANPKAAAVAEEGKRRAWSPEECSCIAEMLAALERDGVPPPPEELLLQVAWSRKLRPEASAALWRQHLEATSRYEIAAISDESVREAYDMGFCERSGKDVDGRPMVWVRMALCEVAKLTPSLAVRNTWLAQDASLRDGDEANRKGLCFVYDLRGLGLKNITFNPRYISTAVRGATSHPMHISRVWLLDPPAFFWAAWRVAQGFLPAHVREVVRFANTGNRDDPACFSPICDSSELPPYLGGDAKVMGGSYAEWMFKRLQGQPLAYREQP